MNPKNQRIRIMESKKLENIFTKQDSLSQKESPFSSEDIEKIKPLIKVECLSKISSSSIILNEFTGASLRVVKIKLPE